VLRFALLLFVSATLWAAPHVFLERVPDGGVQPQVAVEPSGAVHLVYFKGDPAAGDLFYCTSGGASGDGHAFSSPIRVNSIAGSAVATGNIRGPRLALGRGGNVFVLWNGATKDGSRSSLFFTRLNSSRTAFEPQRNLIHTAWGLDGGSGLAADRQGRVYVFWHAPLPGKEGESNRRIWMSRSRDDGRNFSPETVVWNRPTGVCGCCSLAAYAAPDGTVQVLYRAAEAITHRDMYLLVSRDHGSTFTGSEISPWNVSYCVMSSEAFVSSATRTIAAWETEKQIHFSRTDVLSDTAIAPGAGANQKYPALAASSSGSVLLAWTEGMKWSRGGSVHWQLLDRNLRPTGLPGSADGVPPWSVVAAYPLSDGNFAVLY